MFRRSLKPSRKLWSSVLAYAHGRVSGHKTHYVQKRLICFTQRKESRLQNGIDKSGHQVGMAWVELAFDNSDGRIIISGVRIQTMEVINMRSCVADNNKRGTVQ